MVSLVCGVRPSCAPGVLWVQLHRSPSLWEEQLVVAGGPLQLPCLWASAAHTLATFLLPASARGEEEEGTVQ